MSELDISIPDDEFQQELEHLSMEARLHIEERAMRKMLPGMIKAMHPLVLGIEALSRATEANTVLLTSLKNEQAPPTDLSGIVSDVQEKIDQKHQINQQLFDALHAELKSYRDGFLLEVMQKPVVRDLIDFHDLLSALLHQFEAVLAERQEWEGSEDFLAPFKTIETNLQHTRETLLEVLERLDVKVMPPLTGRLDKQRQRAVDVIPAESVEEDLQVHERRKPGFQWRDRIVRPEEVVVKKWKEGYLVMMPSAEVEESK